MSFRIEKKLFVKKENLFEFRKMLFDKGVTTLFKNRKVQSIYFDSLSLQMYNDSIEGLAPRKKIRIRNYPDKKSDIYLFETKISSVEGRFKTNKEISKKYFDRLMSSGIFDKKYGICKPVLNVVYEREYWVKDDVRITLDTNISYNLYKGKIIKKDDNIVVELKAPKSKNLDNLFEEFPFQEIRFSKYCNGIELFNKN